MLENNNRRKSFSTLEELLDDIFRKSSEENNTNSEYRNDYYNERRIDDEEYAKKELEKLSDFLIYTNINPITFTKPSKRKFNTGRCVREIGIFIGKHRKISVRYQI